jgi:hypothetical protein
MVTESDVNAARQEGADCEHDRAGREAQARLGDDSRHALTLNHTVVHTLLE